MLPVFSLIISIAACRSFIPDVGFSDNRLCNPGGLTFRFSGVRVFSSVIYGLPVRHYWSVVHCIAGEISAMQYFPCNRTSNFMFGEPIELDNGEVFILARKKKYAMRNVPIYRPFTFLGAAYSLDNLNNITRPFAPLQADSSATSFSHESASGKRMMTHVSMLYASSDVLNRGWDAGMEVSPYEFYSYSPEDKNTRWYRINMLLNDVTKYTYINERFIPWEFDSLEEQLKGKADWRGYLNLLLPDI